LSAVLASASLFSADLAAQNDVNRVIHLWVDPLHGSDELARGTTGIRPRNPKLGSIEDAFCPAPLAGYRAPNDVLTTLPSGARADLRHAPFAFKTITAAVQYIRDLAPPGTAPLPFVGADDPTTPGVVDRVVWAAAVIHLMPGIYGPNPPTSIVVDPGPALPHNGESFPIKLPPRVSLQGTSALNTILDARTSLNTDGTGIGPILEFGTEPESGYGTYIDSLTLTGVDAATPSFDYDALLRDALPPSAGETIGSIAAVYVGSSHPSRLQVSNCFIVRNSIGVLVAASEDESVVHDEVVLAGNTFARNGIGLWNGQNVPRTSAAETPAEVKGLSRLFIVNNVFDSTFPDDGVSVSACDERDVPADGTMLQFDPVGLLNVTRSNTSAFEGITSDDMRVRTAQSPDVYEDFNAYELSSSALGPAFNAFQGTTYADAPPYAVLPRTVPAGTSPTPASSLAAGATDISAITGEQGSGVAEMEHRGILFVNDLFCSDHSDGLYAQTGTGHDLSPHDFRIAPQAAAATEGLAPVPDRVNPLIDRGIPVAPLRFENEHWMPIPGYIEGQLALAPGTFTFTAFDNDCEGFGNPRVFDHPLVTNRSYPIGSATPSAATQDLGADELNPLLIAGYTDRTTRISRRGAFVPNAPNNDRIWFLGPTGALGGSYLSPSCTVVTGTVPPQPPVGSGLLRNIQYPFSPLWVSQGDAYDPLFQVYDYPTPAPGFPNFRTEYPAEVNQITPHLLPDIHPFWPELFELASPGTGALISPSYPWWLPACAPSLPPINFQLYQDPLARVSNPPGTLVGGTYSTGEVYRYIDVTSAIDPLFSGRFEVQGFADVMIDDTGMNLVMPWDAEDADIWGRWVFDDDQPGGTQSDTFFIMPWTLNSALNTTLTARFSVEYPHPGEVSSGPYGGSQNLQSFDVRIDPANN
jgi:hypothetical protein